MIDPWSRGHHGRVGADKAVFIQAGFDESSTRTPFSAVPSCVPSPSKHDIPGGPRRAQAQLLGLGEIHKGPALGSSSAWTVQTAASRLIMSAVGSCLHFYNWILNLKVEVHVQPVKCNLVGFSPMWPFGIWLPDSCHILAVLPSRRDGDLPGCVFIPVTQRKTLGHWSLWRGLPRKNGALVASFCGSCGPKHPTAVMRSMFFCSLSTRIMGLWKWGPIKSAPSMSLGALWDPKSSQSMSWFCGRIRGPGT